MLASEPPAALRVEHKELYDEGPASEHSVEGPCDGGVRMSPRLLDLNVWSPAGGAIWEGLGAMAVL